MSDQNQYTQALLNQLSEYISGKARNRPMVPPTTPVVPAVPDANAPQEAYVDTDTGKVINPNDQQAMLNSIMEKVRLRHRDLATRAAVGGRKQELREQGQLGYEPVDNSLAASNALRERLPTNQNLQVGAMGWNEGDIETKALPGIGRAFQVTPYGGGDKSTVVTGRYGTGVATPRREGEVSTIEGMPTTDWFARRNGTSIVDKAAAKAAKV